MRIGIIGCGKMGIRHALAIRDWSEPRFHVAALCDVDTIRAEKLADLIRPLGVKVYSHCQEMLEQQALDAVVVATPDHLHKTPVLEAIRFKIPIFCEKPLGIDLQETREMANAAEIAGVPLGVNFNRRYGFGYQKAAEWVKAGKIGDPKHCYLHVLDGELPLTFVGAEHVILTTLLTHHIDLVRTFCGEIESVQALFTKPKQDDRCFWKDIVIVMRTDQQVLATIIAGYKKGQSATYERFRLEGSMGGVEVEDVTRRACHWGSNVNEVTCVENNTFLTGNEFHRTSENHLRHFFQCLDQGQPIPVPACEAVRGLEVIEDILSSIKKHSIGMDL